MLSSLKPKTDQRERLLKALLERKIFSKGSKAPLKEQVDCKRDRSPSYPFKLPKTPKLDHNGEPRKRGRPPKVSSIPAGKLSFFLYYRFNLIYISNKNILKAAQSLRNQKQDLDGSIVELFEKKEIGN